MQPAVVADDRAVTSSATTTTWDDSITGQDRAATRMAPAAITKLPRRIHVDRTWARRFGSTMWTARNSLMGNDSRAGTNASYTSWVMCACGPRYRTVTLLPPSHEPLRGGRHLRQDRKCM